MALDEDTELYGESDVDAGEPVVDPHYLELLRGSRLPAAYLPPMMGGPVKPWVRIAALVVIGVFLFATATGICLTYGVDHSRLF